MGAAPAGGHLKKSDDQGFDFSWEGAAASDTGKGRGKGMPLRTGWRMIEPMSTVQRIHRRPGEGKEILFNAPSGIDRSSARSTPRKLAPDRRGVRQRLPHIQPRPGCFQGLLDAFLRIQYEPWYCVFSCRSSLKYALPARCPAASISPSIFIERKKGIQ